jgi:hypothetical protein
MKSTFINLPSSESRILPSVVQSKSVLISLPSGRRSVSDRWNVDSLWSITQAAYPGERENRAD